MKHFIKQTSHRAAHSFSNVIAFLLLTAAGINIANAQEQQLTLMPTQCVAMQQGQDCYVTIELNWSSQKTDDYCLYATNKVAPLQCWQTSQQGLFKGEIKTSHSIDFQLSTPDRTVILSTAQLTVAWVHKKKGKPRTSWRLF